MSKIAFKVEHTSTVTEYKMDSNELYTLLGDTGAKLHIWDSYFFYVSLEDWGKVFADVLLGMPRFTKDKFDCENFAMLTTARVLERWKLNTCAVVVGTSSIGSHGFNLFIAKVDDGVNIFLLEPQTGNIMPVEEPEGYKPKVIIIG